MKTLISFLLLFALAFFAGCASTVQKNAGTFFAKVASMDITAADVSQSTITPLFSHSESLSGLHHAPGQFSVENLKATYTIPLWGTTWNFSASAISASTPAAVAAVSTVVNKDVPAPAPASTTGFTPAVVTPAK